MPDLATMPNDELWPVWVVYRTSDPWPIRHIITSQEPCSEKSIKAVYYEDFHQFDDDCFRGFADMPSANAFVDSLANDEKGE